MAACRNNVTAPPHTHTYEFVYIYIDIFIHTYIYIGKVKMVTVDEGDLEAPFSIAQSEFKQHSF